MKDIFKDLFGDNIHFESGSGGFREPERLDLEKNLHIPFTTAVFGGGRKISGKFYKNFSCICAQFVV